MIARYNFSGRTAGFGQSFTDSGQSPFEAFTNVFTNAVTDLGTAGINAAVNQITPPAPAPSAPPPAPSSGIFGATGISVGALAVGAVILGYFLFMRK